MSTAPRYAGNLYAPAAIADPYPRYAALRRLGPVVRLARHRAFALPRYAECKQTLRDDGTFISGNGVALNPVANRLSRGTTLNSDGEDHANRRKLLAHRMLPRALAALSEEIDDRAAAIVDAALGLDEVEGVRDLARALPFEIVPDLVGWPTRSRDKLLPWAAATFDALGPINLTSMYAGPSSLAMLRFARRTVARGDVLAGSMGAEVVAAASNGTITRADAAALMVDYLAPSLDTTISATSSALLAFAEYPEQWQRLRADPALISNAVNEVLRFESPLRAFSRKVAVATEIAGVRLTPGDRVLVLYSSANRDELFWDDPDVFDISRDATRHLAFGHGAHNCAGQGLARMETVAMLSALATRVERIELAGVPRWSRNNVIRGLSSLPVRLIPG
jgi:cytochrome P450